MSENNLPTEDRLVIQAATLFDIYDNTSRVIGEIDIPTTTLKDRYDYETSDMFDFEPVLRLYLYKEVAGYSQKEVTERVQNWPYLLQRFGLDRGPTQSSLSYMLRNRFTQDLRQFIKRVAEGIRKEAHENDIRSKDLKSPDSNPSPDEISQSSTPLHHYVDNHAPGVMSNILDDVCPAFDTGRASNTKHEDRKVWEHQTLMSLCDRAGTRSAYRTFNKFRSDALHHDTHLRAVKKLATPDTYQYTFDDFSPDHRPIPEWRQVADTVQDQFNDAVDRLLDQLRHSDEFTEPVVAAIDTVRVPFSRTPYKSEADAQPEDKRVVVDDKTGKTRAVKDNYPVMLNGRKGENHAYEYATLTIIGINQPIILAIEPIRHHSTFEGESGMSVSWAEVVDRLMEQATQHVDIHLVMGDREFEKQAIEHILDQKYDVTYLFPKNKNSDLLKQEIKEVKYDPTLKTRVRPATLYLRDNIRYIDVENDETVGDDGESHDVNLMYVPADREDWIITESNDVNYTVFVTNREDVSAIDAPGLVDRYSKRWEIEIEYKIIKPLLPSIASKDYRMRFFSFAFSCLLYNMWRLTDHSLKLMASEAYDDFGRELSFYERKDPVLPMADFLASSLILMFTGLDPPD